MALKHAQSGEAVDLSDPKEELVSSKTAALVKTNDLEVIHLVVPPGREVPEHRVSGPITLYCLEGHVRLGLSTGNVELRTGEWLYLDGGENHSVVGLDNSRLLLTIVLKP